VVRRKWAASGSVKWKSGPSKAYEAIIKSEEIRGPRIPESFNVLVKELQSLCLGVELTREDGQLGLGEVDAEQIISSRLDDEITELGTEKILEGEAVVADMPLVDLAAGGEDEFEVLDEAESDEIEVEELEPAEEEIKG
jgi:hypothetical protein